MLLSGAQTQRSERSRRTVIDAPSPGLINVKVGAPSGRRSNLPSPRVTSREETPSEGLKHQSSLNEPSDMSIPTGLPLSQVMDKID